MTKTATNPKFVKSLPRDEEGSTQSLIDLVLSEGQGYDSSRSSRLSRQIKNLNECRATHDFWVI